MFCHLSLGIKDVINKMKRNQRLFLSVAGLLLLLTWLSSSTEEPPPLKKPEVRPLAVTRLLQRGYSPEAVDEAYYGRPPPLEPPTPRPSRDPPDPRYPDPPVPPPPGPRGGTRRRPYYYWAELDPRNVIN